LHSQRYRAVSQERYSDTALVRANVLDAGGSNKELRYSYLDMPGIQYDGPLGRRFFTALLSADDPKLFSQEIV